MPQRRHPKHSTQMEGGSVFTCVVSAKINPESIMCTFTEAIRAFCLAQGPPPLHPLGRAAQSRIGAEKMLRSGTTAPWESP